MQTDPAPDVRLCLQVDGLFVGVGRGGAEEPVSPLLGEPAVHISFALSTSGVGPTGTHKRYGSVESSFGLRASRKIALISSPEPHHMLYHMVMGRKEVLVQLDDELVERLDRLAETEGTNRSELLRRGASAVLEAAELGKADRSLREAYRRVPQDPALVASAKRLASLTISEW